MSHWIWFIFPQLAKLGNSYNAKYYGIVNFEEAELYLAHPILGNRIREITNALLQHKRLSAVDVFGGVDALKVLSSMTLFDLISPNDIFKEVLNRFFLGRFDEETLNLYKLRYYL